jgi:hypothetical protein
MNLDTHIVLYESTNFLKRILIWDTEVLNNLYYIKHLFLQFCIIIPSLYVKIR